MFVISFVTAERCALKRSLFLIYFLSEKKRKCLVVIRPNLRIFLLSSVLIHSVELLNSFAVYFVVVGPKKKNRKIIELVILIRIERWFNRSRSIGTLSLFWYELVFNSSYSLFALLVAPSSILLSMIVFYTNIPSIVHISVFY